MNFAALFRAFDTVVVLRDAARRWKGEPPVAPPETSLTATPGLAGQIEARLTNVVVAALKEAFDRDHARLELERAQLEEQRRRAEEAMQLELRRQAADREIGRLRLLAGTALVGWIASVLLLAARLGEVSLASRAILAGGWLLLLAALGAAFRAQGQMAAYAPGPPNPLRQGYGGQAGGTHVAGEAAMWLLVAGLGLSAASLLF